MSFGIALSAYPTSYPFENESFVPADVVPGTPDFSFDDATDPGGYTYRGSWKMEVFGGAITDDDMPYVSHHNGFTMWLMVKVYGAPPVLPDSNWNCTLKGTVYAEADFTGVVDGNTICNVGACCTGLIGKPKYGDDQMTWHAWANDRSASGMCGPLETEDLYCVVVGGHFHANCISYNTAADQRLWVVPCYDNIVRYWLTCAVYKQSYAFTYSDGMQDTPTYTDGLSLDQLMGFDGCFTYHDKICNPYSYFFPGSTGTDSGSQAADTDASSPASTVHFLTLIFAVVAYTM